MEAGVDVAGTIAVDARFGSRLHRIRPLISDGIVLVSRHRLRLHIESGEAILGAPS